MVNTVTHLLPGIGSTIISSNELNLKSENYFTFNNKDFEIKNNQLKHNFDVNLQILPENIISSSVQELKEFLEQNNITKTDIILSIPPCKSVSSIVLNKVENKSKGYNYFFFLVNFLLAMESDYLIFESSNGFIGKKSLIKDIKDQVKSFYKLNIIHTSGIHSNIFQHRKRVFLIFYKSENIKVFNNFNNEKIKLKEFLNYPEELNSENQHIDISSILPKAKNWFDFFIKNNLFDFFHDVNNLRKLKRCLPYLIELRKKDKIINDKFFDNIYNKVNEKNPEYCLDNYRGVYDNNVCIFIKNSCKAITFKSIIIVHPFYNRFLSLREIIKIMGFPDWYKVYDLKQLKVITQTCPSPMITDILNLIINKNYIELTDQDYNCILQNNLDNNMQNNFKKI
jgi:site-specific DNA-cytosine methylase